MLAIASSSHGVNVNVFRNIRYSRSNPLAYKMYRDLITSSFSGGVTPTVIQESGRRMGTKSSTVDAPYALGLLPAAPSMNELWNWLHQLCTSRGLGPPKLLQLVLWGVLVRYDVTHHATSALSDTSSGVHISIVALCDTTHPYNNV